MPYFLPWPRSASSSKDAAQPARLHVHFVLFSSDLVLAPALRSAVTVFSQQLSAPDLETSSAGRKTQYVFLVVFQLDRFPNLVRWMATEVLLLALAWG